MSEDFAEHQREFEAWVRVQLEKKNSTVMKKEDYNSIVKYLQDKEAGKSLRQHERRIGKRVHRNGYKLKHFPSLDLYNVLCMPIGENAKRNSSQSPAASLIGDYKRVVSADKLYDIIYRTHCQELNHGGVNKTVKKIGSVYANLPRVSVYFFVGSCPVCIEKRAQLKYVPVSATESVYFFQRVQVNLIDMTNNPDGLFSWIVHVVDHFSKFTILFPTVGNSAEEIAEDLIAKVFSYFGLPKIMYSENGCEFVDEILAALDTLWAGAASCVTVNEVQTTSGDVEQEESIVEVMIKAREKDEQSSNWSKWLAGIQLALNSNFDASLNKSPFEAVFKEKMNVCNMEIPSEMMDHNEISENVEINEVLDSDHNRDSGAEVKVEAPTESSVDCDIANDDNSVPIDSQPSKSEVINNSNTPVEKITSDVKTKKEESQMNLSRSSTVKNSLVLVPRKTITSNSEITKLTKSNIKKTLKRKSELNLSKVEDFIVGQTVSVFVPKQDRLSSDLKHITCIITEKSGGVKMPTYQLLSAYGTLKQRYTSPKLIDFPYPIKCGNPKVFVTLKEVVEKTLKGS